MVRSGRNGLVKWDAGGVLATAAELLSIKQWALSMKTGKIKVTSFGDANHVYVPGMPDIAGSLTGFWNSADMSLINAARATTPGHLVLVPDDTDLDDGGTPAPHQFSGLAYLDASINTDVEGAPALTGEILAAGPWTIPNENA